MDQDSFRRLLEAGGTQQSKPSRGFLPVPGGGTASSKRKTIDASEPAFKPRKVNKTKGKYRDRAAERRVGEGNDYAEVESVLEDLQKRGEPVSDEQRKYLGGDSEHSILVKGLDVALLEQNKAKAAAVTVDDDSLEQAFIAGAPSQPTAGPTKRKREDIIRELKAKRGVPSSAAAVGESKPEGDTDTLEAAKKQGKFKPIGFKPIGSSGGAEEKPKKKKAADRDASKKKKKRKVEPPGPEKGDTEMPPPVAPAPAPIASSSALPPPALNDIDVDEDLDIFAGADEYEADFGADDDDDEAGDRDAQKPRREEKEPSPPHKSGGNWFANDEPDPEAEPDAQPSAPRLPLPLSVVEKPPPRVRPSDAEANASDEEEGEPTRLVPLSSSVLPSIKELLALDEAANAPKKWRKRKKKGGEDGDDDGGAPEKPKAKMSKEDKAERDYKRLKSYTDKKGV